MKSFFYKMLLVASFAVACPLQADEHEIEVIKVGNDKFLRWHGKADRTYFIQVSDPNDDLKKWTWAPIIETGNDEAISYEVDGTADKGFFRLWFSDQPTSDPDGDDFDFDGLSNWDEVNTHQTNPLMWDSDDDGLPDYWEIEHGLDPNDDGSIDLANGAYGDPDGDGLTNDSEYWLWADPNLADTDSDGLNDYDEVFLYGTNLWDLDSDDDTLNDGVEVLTHATNPLEMDTDGDWMWDDYEIANNLDPVDAADGLLDADSYTLANQLEFVFLDQGYDPFFSNIAALFPWASDPDWDGMTTQLEFVTLLTNPRQPDTDGDGYGDGWEIANAFNAKLNNRNGGPANHHPDADPDGDGRTNAQEEQMGTNPFSIDTEGDGVNDGDEDDQGSNPNDPSDKLPPPNGTVPATFTFGDHSGSHSEKYRVQLTPLVGDTGGVRYRTNRNYGQPQEGTFRLPKGAKYKVEIIHIGTNPTYRGSPRPDYDYTLLINYASNDPTTAAIINDPQGIFGTHNESNSFFADGKDAILYIAWLTSETIAQNPTNRKRDKLGVGEEVNLIVKPPMEDTSWTVTTGELDEETGSTVLLTLKDEIGTAQVNAVFLGQTLTKNFTIYAPTSIDSSTIKTTISYPIGQASAGMHLYPIVVAPTDVSFYNVQMLEVGENATNVSGYFLDHAQLSHIGNGADIWFDLDDKNQWPDTWDFARLTDWPAPWNKPGSFTWNIPAKWRVDNSTGTSPEHTIVGWNQVFSIQIGGTITVQKFGHSVTRTTSNDITSN